MSAVQELRDRRRQRLRYQLRQKGGGRPRLSVFRSGKHIYAQVIDDAQGRTLAAASTLDKSLRESLRTGADKDALPSNVKIVNGNGKHVTPARHSPPNPGVNLNKISASEYTTTNCPSARAYNEDPRTRRLQTHP